MTYFRIFLISNFCHVLNVVCLLLGNSTHNYLAMKMEQAECSETSAYKLQMPGNYPEESIRYFRILFQQLYGKTQEDQEKPGS
jgi:hypothetical protein